MSEPQLDFAVFGSSALAGLVAGLLASRHKRHVVMVGDAQARYRLPRTLDISVAPITRPETWALLKASLPDTSKLITKIGGRQALRRIDPIFFADGLAAREALGHFSHMARAHGMILETVPPAKIGTDRAALRINDAVTIHRPSFEPALETWLAELGIRRFAPETATMAPGGATLIKTDDEALVARRAILVDDSAIFRCLPGWQWPAQLLRRQHATILTASSRHLAGPIMTQLDSGITLVQHEEGGMAAMGPGNLSAFSGELGILLADAGQLQQVGQVGYETLITNDGAPLLGPVAADGPLILTGLGSIGAFLAPVLARWLAGEASQDEAEWCEARRADKRGLGRAVAEFNFRMDEQAA
ncbi:hypothetical protein ASD83_07530 [Devosia sp. Root685]|uniref:hypothetical protein n=1 Tax=Devosia sp. Root685 TaxID=1736587 RepID=UPI0007003796|nr:hypothetical protein [Devosia sp. Root685]KRB01347.1 hypothetical protein ASD83_07530 [Devosia sp. Root685]